MKTLLKAWQETKPLLRKGYEALGKEVTMGMPGPCMPAVSSDQNTGIGSPYGKGAQKVADFFDGVIHKILLGPGGKTNKETRYSPYFSEKAHNPFFIPLEALFERGLISSETLETIYNLPKQKDKIDFNQVDISYRTAFEEAYQKAQSLLSFDAFLEILAEDFLTCRPLPYIGDLQVQIPHSVYQKHPNYFLKDFTLGSPPDAFSDQARNWHFKTWDPDLLLTKDGKIGPAGRILFDLISNTMQDNPGGLRIDHYIGFVNPYVIYKDETLPNGRLYSSPDHPILKQYAKWTLDEFANITRNILLKAAVQNGFSLNQIYPEDIGCRPKELDPVLEACGLGRLLVSQFVDIWDDAHMYRLKNARPHDIATLDTHDTLSIQQFYQNMDEGTRYQHAVKLAQDLRFTYWDGLKDPKQLVRLKWAELLVSPAERVQAFFTSFTGQPGRYNEPGNPDKWTLRCDTDFERLYFKNMADGWAYNPFDAIALAIYARGDAFYGYHADLVRQLHEAEDVILNLARQETETA